MGNLCAKRDNHNFLPENELIDYNPIKIGNLIFLDYSKTARNCCSIQELIMMIPNCMPNEINCSTVTKEDLASKHSVVEIIGTDLQNLEELIMIIEIHEN